MEPFILLLVPFAVLEILDIVGGGRINLKYILFFAVIFLAIFLYNINFDFSKFIASSSTLNSIGIFGSIFILLIFPRIGIGDKIFLATTFLIYPFWFMWPIILLALLLTRPIFKLMSFFLKERDLALPFYPFLFLSTLIMFVIVSIIL